MPEIANLIIKVDSDGVATANERLDQTPKSGEKAERATDSLVGSLKRLVLAYLTVDSAIRAVRKTIEVGTGYQKLEAQVRTAVGTAEDAADAFFVLREIQKDMPFELDEVTEAFTDLTNRGLDGSRRALISYANTATALNSSLGEITQAVVQATNGQLRGLQQLGIKAVETQDGIALTFRGVTTEIGRDVEQIQNFLISLGENEFAEAMANRNRGLEDAVSDLATAWDELFLAVNEGQAGAVIADGIWQATAALEELTAMLASGQLGAELDAIAGKFSGWGEDARAALELITSMFKDESGEWKEDTTDFVSFFLDAFKNLPENVRFSMQAVGATFGFLTEAISATAIYLWERFKITFDQLIGAAVITGKQVANALNPFADEDFDFTDEITKLAVDTTNRLTEAGDKWKQAVQTGGEATAETIDEFLRQRDVAVGSFEAQIAAAKKLRAEYDANRKARQESNAVNDPLARLSGTNAGPRPIVTNESTAAFDSLRKSLELEETVVEDSYRRRLELIRNNTEEGTALRFQLEEALEVQVTAEYAKAAHNRVEKAKSLQEEMNAAIAEGRTEDLAALALQLEFEETQIQDSYLKRRQQILDDTNLTEQQRLEAMTKNEAAYTARLRQLEINRTRIITQNAADLFSSLANIAEQSVGKQNAIYKIAFAASKAFAVADAIVHIQQGIAAAAATPFPANIAAMASVAAATAGIISNITETVLAFEHGGFLPAGRFGVAGETGQPELIRGPARITSTRTTADLMAGRSEAKPVVVNVINQASGVEVDVAERETDQGKIVELIVRRVQSSLAGDVRRGGSQFAKALETTYNVRRGAA